MVVVATNEQVAADLAEEVVILHLHRGEYYGLDGVGARIWSLIQEPRSIDEIRDTIVAEYEVEEDHCRRDLIALLRKLAANQLIEVRDAHAVPETGSAVA